MSTKIAWCKNPDGSQGETWNPTTGCTPIAAGCLNCYAKRMHERFSKEPFDKVVCHEEEHILFKPMRWSKFYSKPRMCFVNSMSDLFHKDVPFEFIEKVYKIINMASIHTFIILTKRPDRMIEFQKWLNDKTWMRNKPLPNLWLGVSISTQKDADKLIPLLLETPAAKRIVSVEPMLEEINFWEWFPKGSCKKPKHLDYLSFNLNPDYENGISGVFCGGESGPKARPCDINHVRNLRDQCVGAGVPFFLKQLNIDGKLVHMPELDGKVWDQIPERKI